MKKITTIIIAILTIWLISTAYISSSTKNYLQKIISYENNYQTNIKLKSFKKGFFISTAKIEISPKFKNDHLKYPITLVYKIYNGPIILKDGITFALNKMVSTIKLSDFFKDRNEFLKLVKNDIIIDINIISRYDKKLNYKASTNKIVIKDNEVNMVISPILLTSLIDTNNLSGNINFISKDINMTVKETKLTLKNIKLNFDIKKIINNNFGIGDFKLNIEKVKITDNKTDTKIDTNANILLYVHENNKLADIGVELKSNFNNSIVNGKKLKFKTLFFNYNFKNIDLNSFITLNKKMEEIKKQNLALSIKLKSTKNDQEALIVFQQYAKLREKIATAYKDFFKTGLIKDKTNLNFYLKVDTNNYIDIKFLYIGENLNIQTLKKDFYKVFDMQLKSKITKSFASTIYDNSKEKLFLGLEKGFIKENPESFSTDINKTGNKLFINGKDKSELLQIIN